MLLFQTIECANEKNFLQDKFWKIKRIANTDMPQIRILAIHVLEIRERKLHIGSTGMSFGVKIEISRLWMALSSTCALKKCAALQRVLPKRVVKSRNVGNLLQSALLASGGAGMVRDS